jgi:hypothetical protein
MKTVGSNSPFSTNGRPRASLKGPVGLFETATPMANLPVARFVVGTYQ